MAIIPSNEQFIGLSSSVNTTERRSALINAESQAYTMQDIVDTVGSALPPAVNPTDQYVPLNYGGEFADSPFSAGIASVGYYGWPILSTQVGQITSLPPGVDQSNVAPYLDYYGLKVQNHPILGQQTVIGDYNGGTNTRLTIDNSYGPTGRIYATVGGYPSLELNRVDYAFTFGDASYNIMTYEAYASGGLSILEAGGEAVIGCGISSGANGVFRASGAQGFISIGNTPSTSIGVNMFDNSMRIGGFLYDTTGPVDYFTPVKWVRVKDELGNAYFLPVYQ